MGACAGQQHQEVMERVLGWAGLVAVPQISHHSLLARSVWEGERASLSLWLGLSAGFSRQWEDRLTRPVGPVPGGSVSAFIRHLSDRKTFSQLPESRSSFRTNEKLGRTCNVLDVVLGLKENQTGNLARTRKTMLFLLGGGAAVLPVAPP